MIPLKFRSLRDERKEKTSPLLVGLWAAMFALAMLPDQALADNSNSIAQLIRAREDCKKAHRSDQYSIYRDEAHQNLRPEFDPKLRCVHNAGDENESHNARAFSHTPNMLRLRAAVLSTSINRTEDGLRTLGVCRAVYDDIKEIYDHANRLTDQFCERSSELKVEADNCGNGTIEKKCLKEWEEVKVQLDDRVRTLREKGTAARVYFNALKLASQKAREGYENDRRRLEPALLRLPAGAASPGASSSCPAEVAEIKPEHGNRATHTCADYFNLLHLSAPVVPSKGKHSARYTNLTDGPLITELAEAQHRLDRFSQAFEARVDREISSTSAYVKQIAQQLEQSEKNDSPGGRLLRRAGEVGPSITPIAQQLMGNQNHGAPNSALSNASSPAPLAALAAVGAAGMIAARSLGGSQSSRETPQTAPPVQPAVPANAPEVAQLGTFQDKGEKEQANKGAIPGAPLEAAKAEETAKASVNEPGIFNGGTGSDGSSRMLSGKKSPQTKSNSGSGNAIDPGGAALNDSMSAFHQNLDPKSVSKTPPANPGNEVANLLGQMKNLFNFDEAGGPLGGAPNFSGNNAPPTGGGGEIYGQGGNSPETPGEGEPAQADEASSAENASAEKSGEQVENLQGSLFGRSDTTLFARVRLRHNRCMERGLVLYELRERVE